MKNSNGQSKLANDAQEEKIEAVIKQRGNLCADKYANKLFADQPVTKQAVEETQCSASLLDSVYLTADGALQFLNTIEEISSSRFTRLLGEHKYAYGDFKQRATLLLENLSVTPPTQNIFSRAVNYGTIKLSTMLDKSNSRLAEILIQHTIMSIIDLLKDIHLHNNASIEARKLASELLLFEENKVEMLKAFL